MSVHRLKDGRWICKIPDPDKKAGSRREYFGRGPVAETRARARDKALGLSLKVNLAAAQSPGPRFVDLSEAYLLHRGLAPHNHARVISQLSFAILPRIGNTPASRLTHSDLDSFVQWRRSNGIKNTTIRRDLTTIQSVMNWAASRRPPLIPANPLKGYAPPQSDCDVIMPPTPAEITAILAHASERLKRFIKIAWYTGLRPGGSELFSLQWDAVLWIQGVIRVTSAKKGGIALREVPIHPGFLPELRQWAESDNMAGHIISYCGHPITRLQEAWKIAKRKAGITRRLRLYDLRHLFVTSAIETGADYKTLAEIVGSSPETLRKYYQHVSSAARVKVIRNMPTIPAGNFGNSRDGYQNLKD